MKTTEEHDAIVKAAFGSGSRALLIDEFFSLGWCLTSDNAWQYVYLLLLWTDRSTRFTHCYEGDERRPWQSWYERSLNFHTWLSGSLGAPTPAPRKIDWVFRKATSAPTARASSEADALAANGARRRQPRERMGVPGPDEDPELASIMIEALRRQFADPPSPEEWENLIERVRHYLNLENNRRDLLDDGFEDVLGAIIRGRFGASRATVYPCRLPGKLPGFRPPRLGNEHSKAGLIVHGGGNRIIVTVQWSIRADLEEQFVSDHGDCMDANESKKPDYHVLVTNEFDPTRLKRACELRLHDQQIFAHVVHVNTYGLMAASVGARERSTLDVLRYIDKQRLINLETWFYMMGG